MKLENPAFDYDTPGAKYSTYRRTDPRIAQYILTALKDSNTILNIGAGSGSYEPPDKFVIAVEPSQTMRSQRIEQGRSPAINARADNLPFDDNSFDASMAIVTIHHWPDIQKGLAEMKRVASKKNLIMTFDPDALGNFWNVHYFPELIEIEKARYPSIESIKNFLGGRCDIIPIPIQLDCIDGFQEAFYGRPEAFLKKEVRRSQSAWGFLPKETEERYVESLRKDLISGLWDKKFGHFRTQPTFTCALRLIVLDIVDC